MADEDRLFDNPYYNWCALEKIGNRDDMEKLRSLYCDFETPLNTVQEGPFSFRRVAGLEPDELASYEGRNLRDLLLSEETTLNQLRVLKEYGKIMMMSALPATTQRTGAVLYTGSIARALVRFNVKISTLSYQQLSDSLTGLLHRPYLIEPIEALFQDALKRCE